MLRLHLFLLSAVVVACTEAGVSANDDDDPVCPDGSVLLDEDGDGFTNDVDCDDANGEIYPGAVERCGQVDHDCDGVVGDEDDSALRLQWFADTDGDGFGDPNSLVESCDRVSGHVEDDCDCDDGDAATFPGAQELLDGVDNDCDGLVDEDECPMDDVWRIETFTPARVSDLGATLIGGDVEFGGFGPDVDVVVQLFVSEGAVALRVYANFAETAPNWSVGRVDTLLTEVYVAPPGCEVVQLQNSDGRSSSVLSSVQNYIDEDADDDTLSSDALVDELVVSGDRVGPDIGFGTGIVTLSFQEVYALLYCP